MYTDYKLFQNYEKIMSGKSSDFASGVQAQHSKDCPRTITALFVWKFVNPILASKMQVIYVTKLMKPQLTCQFFIWKKRFTIQSICDVSEYLKS